MDISVVIPCLNEEENLNLLYSRLKEVLEKEGKEWELIFVDDGSSDSSLKVLKEIHLKDNRVKIVQLRRNFGKAAALSAGFDEAQGETIITVDADLQDDPEDIPCLIEKIEEGDDLVSGWRRSRADRFSKRLSSKIFNFVTSLITGIKIHDFNSSLKAYRKEVVCNIKIYGELHRYIPVLAHLQGYRVSEVVVNHHPRRYGRSKYGSERFIRGFLDLLTVLFLGHYTRRPLHLFGQIGFLFTSLGIIITAYLGIIRLLGHYIGNRPLLLLGILLVVLGSQFVSIGLLGEMMAAAFHPESNYLIKKKLLKDQ